MEPPCASKRSAAQAALSEHISSALPAYKVLHAAHSSLLKPSHSVTAMTELSTSGFGNDADVSSARKLHVLHGAGHGTENKHHRDMPLDSQSTTAAVSCATLATGPAHPTVAHHSHVETENGSPCFDSVPTPPQHSTPSFGKNGSPRLASAAKGHEDVLARLRFTGVDATDLPNLRALHTVVFPVTYNDTFYSNVLNTGDLSRLGMQA